MLLPTEGWIIIGKRIQVYIAPTTQRFNPAISTSLLSKITFIIVWHSLLCPEPFVLTAYSSHLLGGLV
jgi:hypothetical protein